MNLWKKQASITRKVLKTDAGFSLVEILVALTLIGLAGTFVVGKIFNNLNDGRVKATNIQMSGFASQLKEFRRKCNFYPDTAQGLESLIEAPSGRECKNYPPGGFLDLENIPLDPWESEFIYESDGKKFTIKSLGADTQEGGELPYDADILYPPNRKSN
jgi:general secretion pathway protein G